jgi:TM2 domain-containing membrane protein YozV
MINRIHFIFLFIIIFFVLSAEINIAQQSLSSNDIYTLSKNDPTLISFNDSKFRRLELSEKVIYNNKRISLFDSTLKPTSDTIKTGNEKSPIVGAVLSGIIPGAGQFYAKKYLKSAVFFAVEAGLWIAYSIFEKKGDEQTDNYQRYADANWSMKKYGQWLKEQQFEHSQGIDTSQNYIILRQQINYCEEYNFSHQLPPPGEQQYYEVIGKYRNYMIGWSQVFGITRNDWDKVPIPPQIDWYMNERQKANDFYNRGSITLSVIIINHLLSAADGVLSVNSYNEKISFKTSASVRSVYSYKDQRYSLAFYGNLSILF